MEIKDFITDKDISIRMKELGFPQESLFYWLKPRLFAQHYPWRVVSNGFPLPWNKEYLFSAPTASEIIKKFPPGVDMGKQMIPFYIIYGNNGSEYYCGLECIHDEHICNNDCQQENFCKINKFGETFENALGSMWIYLKENKLI